MSWMGIEPGPSNIGDKLAWPRVHTASDPLSYIQTAARHINIIYNKIYIYLYLNLETAVTGLGKILVSSQCSTQTLLQC